MADNPISWALLLVGAAYGFYHMAKRAVDELEFNKHLNEMYEQYQADEYMKKQIMYGEELPF